MPYNGYMTKERKSRIAAFKKNGDKGLAVVLEDIHDPHNAGAIFRTCDAFGIREVYLVFHMEKPWNPRKTGKAAASAGKWLTFKVFRSPGECVKELRRRKFKVWATLLDKAAQPLGKARFKGRRIALVFGNEHRGISPELAALADRKLYIPMKGMVQSLNLSVTAAICIYEASRQRSRV